MTTAYQTTGVLRRGLLKIRNRDQMLENLKHWRDGEVTLTIERKHAHRSTAANRYYWGVVVAAISEHTGYTPEETHEALKTLFLPKKLAMVEKNGEVVNELVIGGSTTKLNTVEFSDYVTRIREWATDNFDLDIPSATRDE
jgi:hypothetical protein